MATTPAKATFPLILEDTYVRQDEQGRFSLNDLHQAAGGEDRHRPTFWLRLDQTQALVDELGQPTPDLASATPSNCADLHSFKTTEISRSFQAVSKIEGRNGGTFVARELVYAYAMWISPSFHLKVIRVFKEYATKGMVMKPEVAKQAFEDPKVFMAKVLVLAQETLEKYAPLLPLY